MNIKDLKAYYQYKSRSYGKKKPDFNDTKNFNRIGVKTDINSLTALKV